MEAFLFASLNRKVLSPVLGEPDWDAPDHILGDAVKFTIRPSVFESGQEIEVERTVSAIRASLGLIDARPTSGTFALTIEGMERTFTAANATDVLTSAGHGLANGDRLRLTTTATLPAGLMAGLDYFVIGATTDTFQIALIAGGSAVDFTTDGTGTLKAAQLTADLSFDDTDDTTAEEMETAINALADVGSGKTYGEVSAEIRDGSWLVTGPDEIPLIVAANSLAPISFVRVRPYDLDDATVHEIRLIQAPLAFATTFEQVVPPAPYFIDPAPQDGGSQDGFEWPEVQALVVPANFRGGYQIRRNGKRSLVLSREDGADRIAEAMAGLEDDGGEWTISNPRPNVAHIEFGGSMIGIDHDPLDVVVFDAPAGDYQIELDLGAAEAFNFLRGQASATVVLEIEITYEDDQDDEITHKATFRKEVTFRRELIADFMATAPNLDWLRPPLPRSYRPFTPDQVRIGQLSYSASFPNALEVGNDVFTFDHGLETDEWSGIAVRENGAAGALLVLGTDYTVAFDDENALTVEILPARGTPALNELLITMTAAEPVAVFQGHTHTIPQVEDLETTLDAMAADIANLKLLAPTSVLARTDPATTGGSIWPLPPVLAILPRRVQPVADDFTGPTVRDWADGVFSDAFGNPLRAPALLPAVHDAEATSLSTILSVGELPETDIARKGSVFVNDSGDDVTIPGGGGRRSRTLEPGGYAADDGRFWYAVTPYGLTDAIACTADAGTDVLTTLTGHRLSDGDTVQLTTTGTLPAGLSLATDYFVINRTATTFQLSATSGGDAINITDTGSGTHTVTKQGDVSFYPSDFEIDLFALAVNRDQLRIGRNFEVKLGLETAILSGNTSASWVLQIDLGDMTQDSSPATPGLNLADVVWRPTPALSIPVVVTSTPSRHVAGIRVLRRLVSAVDTLSLDKLLYDLVSGGQAPDSADFAVRGRLTRFDPENEDEPKGFLVLAGPARGLDGTDDPTLGLGKIT